MYIKIIGRNEDEIVFFSWFVCVFLVPGAFDGGVQHCYSSLEIEFLWHVWAGKKQCSHEWLFTQGKVIQRLFCLFNQYTLFIPVCDTVYYSPLNHSDSLILAGTHWFQLKLFLLQQLFFWFLSVFFILRFLLMYLFFNLGQKLLVGPQLFKGGSSKQRHPSYQRPWHPCGIPQWDTLWGASAHHSRCAHRGAGHHWWGGHSVHGPSPRTSLK